jgi:hypothetical protein
MRSGDFYRAKAAQIQKEAGAHDKASVKRELEAVARSYLRLADQVEDQASDGAPMPVGQRGSPEGPEPN